MRILKVISDSHNEAFYVPFDVFNTKVTKGYKRDLGKKLGDVLELKILNDFNKEIIYEESKTKSMIDRALYYATEMSSKKRKEEFLKWTPVNTIGLGTINSVKEQKQINKELDEWADRGYKQMMRETAHHPKSSEIFITDLAKPS